MMRIFQQFTPNVSLPMTPAKRPGFNRRQGFSLIEILLVIALIALLAGLVVTNLDTIMGSNQEKIAKTFVTTTLKVPLTQYRFHVGSYPSTEEGLKALRRPPSGKESKWKGPYIESLPLDPWGNEYQYQFPGTHNKNGYDLWSTGPNPEDPGSHIGNWVTNENS